MRAPYLPETAPFTPEQRQWLNGFFAGWAVSGAGAAPDGAASALPFSGDGQAAPVPELAVSEAPAYSRTNPFPARLLTNARLNAEGSAKDVRHVEISLEGSGLTYEAGDALGVMPQNDADYVDALLAALGLDGDETVVTDRAEVALRDALEHRLTITTPSKPLLDAYADQQADLRGLLADEKKAELADFLWGRDVLDLAHEYPTVRFEPQAFVDLLRPLAHRLYSISSSPAAHPGEVHLTVGTVRYEARERGRKGVCSTYLADRCHDTVGVFVHANKAFRLPADGATPVVMVGPGTGIAPFRAFLEERRATGATGENWLFFGDQHEATDYLYRDEVEAMRADGTLSRLSLAWSRDGAEKVYVQHLMLREAEALFDWLERGAAVYVCGDASRMAKDVDAALHEVVRQAGGLDEAGAAAYVKALKKAKRYLRDVY